MHIWVIERGEFSEGGSILEIVDSYAKALEYIHKYIGIDGKKNTTWCWKLHEEDNWSSGCDWLSIIHWEVS